MRTLLALAVALLVTLAIAPVGAWGVKGHAWTCENAVLLLPEGELRDLMAKELPYLTGYALAPDFQLKDGVGEDLEAPNHYMDLDAIDPMPHPEDWPRTRVGAARFYSEHGLSLRDGGFLPWRIEEQYEALVNAFATGSNRIGYYGGLLAHYAADATQPLHATKHYNGLIDPETGERKLRGIHADYEIVFLEDHGIEFRQSSLALAEPAAPIPDVFAAALDMVCESYGHFPLVYEVAERHQGPDRYEAWDAEMGGMTRDRLAKAATFIASLWLSAWEEAQGMEVNR